MAARRVRYHEPHDLLPPTADLPMSRGVELALDIPPPVRLSTLAVRRDDKRVFDEYQALCSAERGERATQWEAFTQLLAEAMANPSGRFARWRRR